MNSIAMRVVFKWWKPALPVIAHVLDYTPFLGDERRARWMTWVIKRAYTVEVS